MAVMADFARMPTQRKVFVFVIAGAVLFGIYYQLVFKPLQRKVEAAKADHSAKQALNAKYEADLPKYEELKTRMSNANRILACQEGALPTEAELPAFFETLNHKVLESGVEVKSSQREKEEKVEAFIKVPVTIEITGTFMQIKKFFASLSNKKEAAQACSDKGGEQDRIVSIENLHLNDPQVINHELVLHARFTATTYREEPTEEAAPASAGPAKPGAKPLPPADTPAGARIRTEDSMDKDRARTRNAPGNPAEGGAGSAKLKGGL